MNFNKVHAIIPNNYGDSKIFKSKMIAVLNCKVYNGDYNYIEHHLRCTDGTLVIPKPIMKGINPQECVALWKLKYKN